MLVNKEVYTSVKNELDKNAVTLVAVSKVQPIEKIKALYELGQRDFGENYVQELVDKQQQLPADIRWHFIGHLQSNKVKFIAPFVHLIHGVDSGGLLKEINKQGKKNNRVIDVLLQVHIAQEETKFGFDPVELHDILSNPDLTLANVRICGLMGMASFSDDMQKVRDEFHSLKLLFDQSSVLKNSGDSFKILSSGMSSDYKIAIEEGSTMVRIGSLLFGARQYHQ